MHVVSWKKLLEAVAIHPSLDGPLDSWYRVAKRARWRLLDDIRKVHSAADNVGKYTVFNIKGNSFRLIAEINYAAGRVHVRHILTHAE